MFRNQTSPKLPWKDFFLHLQLCLIVKILSKKKYYVTNCYICIWFKDMYLCEKIVHHLWMHHLEPRTLGMKRMCCTDPVVAT
jgi:hypothetical protein